MLARNWIRSDYQYIRRFHGRRKSRHVAKGASGRK